MLNDGFLLNLWNMTITMLLLGFLGVSWLQSAVFFFVNAAKAPVAPAWMEGRLEAELIFLPQQDEIRRAA